MEPIVLDDALPNEMNEYEIWYILAKNIRNDYVALDWSKYFVDIFVIITLGFVATNMLSPLNLTGFRCSLNV